ncbi:MAG: KH domain-containing protein [Patescibacteria group bacterium]|nr:KH domain-containing protein [Patescibacteria group bacterium]
MKKALSYIISSIVDNPEKVEISEEEADGVVNFTITVAKEDMGKIIGKNGKVIKAIRNVVKIPAIKQGKKIYISLSENPQ